MTGRLKTTPRAKADLLQLATYIARDNPAASDRFVDALRTKSQLLAEFPGIGHPDHERPGRRVHPVGSYLIMYREDPGGITVLRYLHGRRDLRRLR